MKNPLVVLGSRSSELNQFVQALATLIGANPISTEIFQPLVKNATPLQQSGAPSKSWFPLRRQLARRLRKSYDEDAVALVEDALLELEQPTLPLAVSSVARALCAATKSAGPLIYGSPGELTPSVWRGSSVRFVHLVVHPARSQERTNAAHSYDEWRDDHLAILRHFQSLDEHQFFALRYEDLIENSSDVLQSLLGWLDVNVPSSTFQGALDLVSHWKLRPDEIDGPIDVSFQTMLLRLGYSTKSRGAQKPTGLRGRLSSLLSDSDASQPRKRGPGSLSKKERESLKDEARWRFRYPSPQRKVIESSGQPKESIQTAPRFADVPELVVARVLKSANERAQRPALEVDGDSWTYEELSRAFQGLAARLRSGDGPHERVAIFAEKTAPSYVGILSCLLAGATYVPVNPTFPLDRQRKVLERSGATKIIVSKPQLSNYQALANELSAPPEVIELPTNKSELLALLETSAAAGARPPEDRESIAYLLFTSGSSGEPKGVAVTHANLANYVHAALPYLSATPEDRFSQTFELTFDLSVHDMFLAWCAGACLVVPTENDLKNIGEYIRRERISQWFSVPSLAHSLRLDGSLKSGVFPSIRRALFCGEALPRSLARSWQDACPNSAVENWYGPTEATIACTRYAVDRDELSGDVDGLVPIGEPLASMGTIVCDERGQVVPQGTAGDLYLFGAQLAEGYVDAPELTQKAFVELPGREGRFYRTGDRAIFKDGELHFIGRSDNQVKVRGFRIELGDVEVALRKVTCGCNCVALTWPPKESNPEFILGAVEGPQQDSLVLMGQLKELLPDYMVPAALHFFDAFPTGASGKTDRKELSAQIQARTAHAHDIGEEQTNAQRLLQAIRSVNPNIPTGVIESAPSLLAAGFDSLSFVRLTVEIEKRFSKPLDQEAAAHMSRLPFYLLVQYVFHEDSLNEGTLSQTESETAGETDPSPARVINLKTSKRANRAVQFVEHFPQVVATLSPGTWLVLGSSCTLRGVSPTFFEQHARKAQLDLKCINAGLLDISVAGMVPVCEFIRDAVGKAPYPLAGVVWELDPMQVSTAPPAQEGFLPAEILKGGASGASSTNLRSDFLWDAERAGHVEFDEAKVIERQFAAWEVEREGVVRSVYSGSHPLEPKALAAWVKCASILKDCTSNVYGYVHPVRRSNELQHEHAQSHRLRQAIAQCEREALVKIMGADLFDIPSGCFIDGNHVNPWDGARKLTGQLLQGIQENHH